MFSRCRTFDFTFDYVDFDCLVTLFVCCPFYVVGYVWTLRCDFARLHTVSYFVVTRYRLFITRIPPRTFALIPALPVRWFTLRLDFGYARTVTFVVYPRLPHVYVAVG